MQKLIRKLPKRFANCELQTANSNPGFKELCDPERDSAILNHVFTNLLLVCQMTKVIEYMKILKHSKRVKNVSVKGVVD